jgi:hypothetical protein
MREEITPARRLPPQLREIILRKPDQQEAGLAGEVLLRSAAQLMCGGEMDEAVPVIHRRALEPARVHRLAPFGLGQNLLENSHARPA